MKDEKIRGKPTISTHKISWDRTQAVVKWESTGKDVSFRELIDVNKGSQNQENIATTLPSDCTEKKSLMTN